MWSGTIIHRTWHMIFGINTTCLKVCRKIVLKFTRRTAHEIMYNCITISKYHLMSYLCQILQQYSVINSTKKCEWSCSTAL